MKSSSFSDIYSQWESSHDEGNAIEKRISGFEKKPEKQTTTITQLKKMKVRDELDLHCVKLEDALVQTDQFIEYCYNRKYEKIRIITGKGLHSEGGRSVLRDPVTDRIRCNSHVREINTHPKPEDGGTGAIIVYLKS